MGIFPYIGLIQALHKVGTSNLYRFLNGPFTLDSVRLVVACDTAMDPWPHGLTLSDGQETPEVGKDWLWKAAHHLQLHG